MKKRVARAAQLFYKEIVLLMNPQLGLINYDRVC